MMSKSEKDKPSENRSQKEHDPQGIGKILSLLLAVLLAVLVPLGLVCWDVYRVVFNPPLMKQVLTRVVTESDLLPVALEWYAEMRAEKRAETSTAIPWIDEPDIVEMLAILGVPEWRAERQEVLPDEILAEWVSVTVDGTYAWIDDAYAQPQIVWDMESFKRRVSSEHGHNAIQIVSGALQSRADRRLRSASRRGA